MALTALLQSLLLTTLHYITLHCTALHYTTIHCTGLCTLHSVQCTKPHDNANQWTAIQGLTVQCSAVQCPTTIRLISNIIGKFAAIGQKLTWHTDGGQCCTVLYSVYCYLLCWTALVCTLLYFFAHNWTVLLLFPKKCTALHWIIVYFTLSCTVLNSYTLLHCIALNWAAWFIA